MIVYTEATEISSSAQRPGEYDIKMKVRMSLSHFNTVKEIRQGVVDAVLNQAREQGWPVTEMPFVLTGASCRASTVGDDIVDVEGTFLPSPGAKERAHELRTMQQNRSKMWRPRAPWNF